MRKQLSSQETQVNNISCISCRLMFRSCISLQGEIHSIPREDHHPGRGPKEQSWGWMVLQGGHVQGLALEPESCHQIRDYHLLYLGSYMIYRWRCVPSPWVITMCMIELLYMQFIYNICKIPYMEWTQDHPTIYCFVFFDIESPVLVRQKWYLRKKITGAIKACEKDPENLVRLGV